MKAVMHYHTKGIPGLKYQDTQEEKPGYGEVKVKLITVGLNRRDLFIINKRNEDEQPFIPGSDGAELLQRLEKVFQTFLYIVKLLLIQV